MRGVVFSVVFHTLLVLAVAMGLPWLHKTPKTTTQTMTVDVVRLSDITQDTKGDKPTPKPAKKPDADRNTTKKAVARDKAAPEKPEEKGEKAATPSRQSATPPTRRTAKAPQKTPEKKIAQADPVKPDPVKPDPVKPDPVKPDPVKPAPRKKAPDTAKRVEIDPRALTRRADRPDAKKPQIKKPVPPVRKPAKKVAKTPPRTQTAEKPKKAKAEPRVAARPRLRPAFKRKTPPRRQIAEKPPEKKAPDKKAAKKRRPRNALDSVFKSVRKMKQTARTESDRDRTAERTRKGSRTATRSRPMTLSEIESVRHQIKPCWRFPIGAKNADTLRVMIKIWLDRDGTVRRAQVMDRDRMTSDSHFRAAAEAGRRAVMNPACNPLKLPADKYDRWKVLIIDFDPSKLRTG